MPALPDFVEDLGGGVFAIDTGFQRPRFDAAYLLVHQGRAAFIDSGTNHAVPRHLAALEALGLRRDAVDWVIPTHVHLDHAGGAGLLMRELPGASMLVHPRGARHMIDPTALVEGALAVYGAAEMARSYGELVAVDEARVRLSHDGMDLTLGADRVLHLIDTPGHARHHHCIWDAHTRGWFSGDTFGSSYREFDTARGAWIFPNTVPTQFDPPALRASVARLLAFEPDCIYLTHYSRVREVPRAAQRMLSMLDAMVTLALRLRTSAQRHNRLKRELAALYAQSLAEHGVAGLPARMALLDMDVELNAQGIGIWLDREAEQSKAGAP
ncbi:MAG: MBL fold metallo-hydrolase [Burkholderiaceae bacterium]|nr:MBL fold metallo-hydrolase [Burkholderiaceae bacterium]